MSIGETIQKLGKFLGRSKRKYSKSSFTYILFEISIFLTQGEINFLSLTKLHPFK
jgi:hypothetical protein